MEQNLIALSAFADIQDKLLSSPYGVMGLLGAGGSFVEKMISGRAFVYYQWMEGGEQRQAYVAPAGPRMKNLLTSFRKAQNTFSRLAKMAVAAGNTYVDPHGRRTLQELAAAGVFLRGAVLVGSYAFSAYQNMLGVRFGEDVVKTGDVDINAPPTVVELSVPVEVFPTAKEILSRIDPEYSVLLNFSKYRQLTSFGVTGGLKIEFLTPMTGKPRFEPVKIPWLGVYAQPLRFMDYLVKDSVRTACLYASGACLVNVPDPCRYAVHKLIVADRRRGDMATAKRAKDLRQAGELLSFLHKDRSRELAAVFCALPSRAAVESVRRMLDRIDLSVDIRTFIAKEMREVPLKMSAMSSGSFAPWGTR